MVRGEHARAVARLAALEADGRLVQLPGDRWSVPAQAGLVAGRLTVNPAGFGFCQPDDPALEDVHVPARSLGSAMHGDRVLVHVGRGRGERPRGRVVRVLAHGVETLAAVFRRARGRGVLVPQDPRITVPIGVAAGAEHGAREGDLVIARLVRRPAQDRAASARVERVLGPADDPRVQTDAVIHAHDLPLAFPPEVASAARRLRRTLPATELRERARPAEPAAGHHRRRERARLRRRRPGRAAGLGGFRLTVAVADVAHYVREDGPIDREARARGTSVYFPDRVIPMLPEELSNDICSLRPGEDRLVQVVRLDLDARRTPARRRVPATA